MLYTAPVTYNQGWDLAKVFEPNRDDWHRPADPDLARCWEELRQERRACTQG